MRRIFFNGIVYKTFSGSYLVESSQRFCIHFYVGEIVMKFSCEIKEGEVKEILKHLLFLYLLSPEGLRSITGLLKSVTEQLKMFF